MGKEFNEYRKRYRAKKKAQGLCVQCGTRPNNGTTTYCDECAKKRREYSRELYKAYSDLRICPKCRKNKLVGDEGNCLECRAVYSERTMRNRDRDHYNKIHREWQMRTHYEAIEKGICTRCRKNKASDGFKTCAKCRDKLKNYKRKASAPVMSKDEKYALGLCYYCNNPRLPNYKLCQRHYDLNMVNSRKVDRSKLKMQYNAEIRLHQLKK